MELVEVKMRVFRVSSVGWYNFESDSYRSESRTCVYCVSKTTLCDLDIQEEPLDKQWTSRYYLESLDQHLELALELLILFRL